MKITLNPDLEIVSTVKEGLKQTGGYCPCLQGAHRGNEMYVSGISGTDQGSCI